MNISQNSEIEIDLIRVSVMFQFLSERWKQKVDSYFTLAASKIKRQPIIVNKKINI